MNKILFCFVSVAVIAQLYAIPADPAAAAPAAADAAKTAAGTVANAANTAAGAAPNPAAAAAANPAAGAQPNPAPGAATNPAPNQHAANPLLKPLGFLEPLIAFSKALVDGGEKTVNSLLNGFPGGAKLPTK